MNGKINVIVSKNIDINIKMNRLPKIGETTIDIDCLQTFGVKAPNQAIAAVTSWKKVIFNLVSLKKIYLSIVNNSEYDELAKLSVINNDQVKIAANNILGYECKNLIIALDAKGCYYKTQNISYYVSSFKLKATYTTAVGNTNCKTLASTIPKGKTLKDVIRFANVTSAISLTRFETQLIEQKLTNF